MDTLSFGYDSNDDLVYATPVLITSRGRCLECGATAAFEVAVGWLNYRVWIRYTFGCGK